MTTKRWLPLPTLGVVLVTVASCGIAGPDQVARWNPDGAPLAGSAGRTAGYGRSGGDASAAGFAGSGGRATAGATGGTGGYAGSAGGSRSSGTTGSGGSSGSGTGGTPRTGGATTSFGGGGATGPASSTGSAGGTTANGMTSGAATGGTAGASGGAVASASGSTGGTTTGKGGTGGAGGSTGGATTGKGGTGGAGVGGTTAAGGGGEGGTTSSSGCGSAGVFCDDFEKDTVGSTAPAGWITSNGTFTIVSDGGNLVVQQTKTGGTTSGRSLYRNQTTADYTVQARVKIVQFGDTTIGSRAGVIARYHDSSNSYNFCLTGNNMLALRVGGGSSGMVTGCNDIPFNVAIGTWYTLRITVSGSTITTYLDGVQKQTCKDTSLTAPDKAGLFTVGDAPGTLAAFDDVEISTP